MLQKEIGHHNHDPNAMTIGVANALTELKNDASKNERKRACQMVQDLVSRSTHDVGSNLPSTRAMRQIVTRIKAKHNKFPKEPENLKFHLDVNFIKEKDQTFVALDEFFNDQRVIVITNLQFVKFLGCANYWMLDGTFKIAPSIFKQLYTIHADVHSSKAFPLAFGLCSAKSESIYDKMFQMLIDYAAENNVKLEPKLSITDFEKAAINSLKNNFSDIQTEGCHFHLGQIIYRRIQVMGFTSKYGQNEEFSLKMRAILALSFISSEKIPRYFDKLFEVLDDDGRKVATWFSENYIYGKVNRPPQFSPRFWSCFNRNLKNLPRTQNFAESWHHRIHKIIDAEHVGVYKIINELHKEIIFIKSEIGKIYSGAPPLSKKTKYIQKEIRISRILENETQYTELEFLLALAKNMRLE